MRYLFYLLLIVPFHIQSQVYRSDRFNIQLSESIPLEHHYLYGFKNKNNIYLLTLARDKCYLDVVNSNNLELISESEGDWETNGKNEIYLEIIHLKEKTYVFYSNTSNFALSERKIYAREIDLVNGRLLEGKKEVLSIPRYHEVEQLKIESSIDSTKILVSYYRITPKIGIEKITDLVNDNVIGVYVLNENLKHINGDEFELPIETKDITILRTTLNSKGDIAVLRVDSDLRDATINYSHLILYPIEKDSVYVHSEFPFDAKHHSIDEFRENQSGGYFFSGKFAQPNRNFMTGTYIAKIDSSGECTIGLHDFPIDVLTEGFSSDKKKKLSERLLASGSILNPEYLYNLNYLEVEETIFSDDGSCLFLCHMKGGMSDYNDLYIQKISAGNKLLWTKKIIKQQHFGFLQNLHTYAYIKNKGKHHFIYSDHKDNLSIESPYKRLPAKKIKDTYIAITSINDTSGVCTTEILLNLDVFTQHEVKGISQSSILKIDDSSFLMCIMFKNEEYVLMKISEKD